MNDDFAKALRRSLDLTRAGDPGAATRVIQQALQGGMGPVAAPVAASVQAPEPAPKPARKRASGPIEDAEVLSTKAPRQPLGAVVSALRRAKAPARGRTAPPVIPGTRFEARHHSGPEGARDYRLFLPSSRSDGIRGLVVMLHGCTQTPEDFASGTAMSARAEEQGFAVIWPEQTRAQNSSLCWNWFRPGDQGRGGEPAILHALTAAVAAELGAPPVFVAGLSAGGAMAALLGQNYPETFRAVGVHSGLAPGAARDVMSAFGAMRGDVVAGKALGVPAIIFHGLADQTVAPAHARQLTGALQGAQNEAGQSAGRHYSVTRGRNGAGHPVECWSIEGAGHAWAGGSAAGSYTDPAGPDASREMMRFFSALLN